MQQMDLFQQTLNKQQSIMKQLQTNAAQLIQPKTESSAKRNDSKTQSTQQD